MMKLIRHLLMVVCAMLGLTALPAFAAEAIPEYTLKAGYLYNFALLTEWPVQSADATFDICFYGQEDLGTAPEVLRGKVVGNQPIQVRHITKPEEAGQCELLFVSGVDRNQFRQLATELGKRPVLTVTDDNNLSQSGVMVFLKPERQRLAFDINLGAAKQSNLNISSRLLRLAKGVATE